MTDETGQASHSKPSGGIKNGDRWVAMASLLLGGVLFYETFFFKTFDWDPVGMAFWPRVLLAILAAISLLYLIRGSIDGLDSLPVHTSVFVWFAGAMIYVASLELLGFYLSTFLAVTIYSYLIRPPSLKGAMLSALLAVFCLLTVHLIFVEAMNVSLPTGIWD